MARIKIARHAGERHDEKVPEGVAVELPLGEPVLEKLRKDLRGARESDQAVPDVAGSEGPQVSSQSSGGTSRVGHGHDRLQLFEAGLSFYGAERLQKGGQAGAPAYRDHAPEAQAGARVEVEGAQALLQATVPEQITVLSGSSPNG